MLRRSIGLLPLLAAGCSGAPAPDHAAITQLVGVTWVLHRLDDRAIARGPDAAATVRFTADHRIAGSSRCNRVSSPEQSWNVLGLSVHWDTDPFVWHTDPAARSGTFDPGRLVTTAVGCPPLADSSGERFWERMQRAQRWSRVDDRLTIRFADGSAAVLRALPR